MIVEVFFKGSNFKKLHDTIWNIKEIKQSGRFFILVNTEGAHFHLDTEAFELRVCY